MPQLPRKHGGPAISHVNIDRLDKPADSLRDIVESDLRRAARLIIRVQDEIDPQFRFATPEGDYYLAVTLPSDPERRSVMLDRIKTLMAWKQVRGFTISSELMEPDAIYTLGVFHDEVISGIIHIERSAKPWSKTIFKRLEWLPASTADPILLDLLPRGPRAMTPKDVSMCQKWFGPESEFPLVHVETGELRDV